jgi:hypothetical protein
MTCRDYSDNFRRGWNARLKGQARAPKGAANRPWWAGWWAAYAGQYFGEHVGHLK